jgi:hypothetical protein
VTTAAEIPITDWKPPFPWFGGKSRAADLIWRRLGPVENYVEPFFGSGAILFSRPHDPGTETVNDKDRFVANFWRAVQSDSAAVAAAANWPINEADLESRHQWLMTTGVEHLASILTAPDAFDARIAGWWVWGQCAWIGSGWCSGEGPWRVDGGKWLRNAGQGVNRQLPHLGDAGKGVNRKLPHLRNAGKGTSARHHDYLVEYMQALSDRLRYIRVACGDWRRVLTPSITFRHGITGVVLNPPYGTGEVDYSAGGNRSDVATQAREWAIENGGNPGLRIALCGYDGQFDMPDSWSVESWTAAGGYSSTAEGDTEGKENRHRERVWFSPACVPVAQGVLFGSEAK